MGGNTNKTKKEIKIIAFDWGNTLGSNSDDWQTDFKEILDLTGLTFDELQYSIFDSYWHGMREGKLTSDDFWSEVYRQSPNRVKPGTLEKIYFKSIKYNPEMFAIVHSLKLQKRFVLVIASNDDRLWMEAKCRKFSLYDIFEKIYVSAGIGLAKPHEDFYKYILKDLNVKPSELLFIDNELDNCQAAAELGIRIIHYKSLHNFESKLNKIIEF